ncbi:hypothetical protein SERLADRAFT_463423 [Serpula lacrymans var. lacrymans S7.9]|uniref:Uncharacterized protein n=1 Tax=Serpula lacrymans var. lacrymans (strain S7.9) TaxID=578457 RepID=F8NS85_SERL9|nr:uncharacterized protein SERLADRAFT_463423 [Serpula lacrymans var. lacrymans S7.9]EGO26394.1 hypothetical protein SERLADRAFT_463423 [Serpula lacrymans var. lacrymans S7.9]
MTPSIGEYDMPGGKPTDESSNTNGKRDSVGIRVHEPPRCLQHSQGPSSREEIAELVRVSPTKLSSL